MTETLSVYKEVEIGFTYVSYINVSPTLERDLGWNRRIYEGENHGRDEKIRRNCEN